MVLLQKLSKILKTFGDISDYILKKLLHGSTRVAFFLTDYYLEDFIKSMERDSWSAYGTIDFLWHDWSTNLKHSHQLDGKELYDY